MQGATTAPTLVSSRHVGPDKLLPEGTVERVRVALGHRADGSDVCLAMTSPTEVPLCGVQHKPCVFCSLTAATCVPLHSTARTFAVLDRNPVARGHTLVVLRRHTSCLEDLTDAEVAELFTAARAVATALVAQLPRPIVDAADAEPRGEARGYNLGINNGRCAGQSVPHVHVHVIPRSRGDGFWCTHKPWDMERAKQLLLERRHRL